MWHSKWGLLLCTQGIARNLWSSTKGKQLTKAVTAQTYTLYLLHSQLKLGQAPSHRHTHKPNEDEIIRRKERR